MPNSKKHTSKGHSNKKADADRPVAKSNAMGWYTGFKSGNKATVNRAHSNSTSWAKLDTLIQKDSNVTNHVNSPLPTKKKGVMEVMLLPSEISREFYYKQLDIIKEEEERKKEEEEKKEEEKKKEEIVAIFYGLEAKLKNPFPPEPNENDLHYKLARQVYILSRLQEPNSYNIVLHKFYDEKDFITKFKNATEEEIVEAYKKLNIEYEASIEKRKKLISYKKTV